MPFLPPSKPKVKQQAAEKCHKPTPHFRLNCYCVFVCVAPVQGLSTSEVSQYLSQREVLWCQPESSLDLPTNCVRCHFHSAAAAQSRFKPVDPSLPKSVTPLEKESI